MDVIVTGRQGGKTTEMVRCAPTGPPSPIACLSQQQADYVAGRVREMGYGAEVSHDRSYWVRIVSVDQEPA